MLDRTEVPHLALRSMAFITFEGTEGAGKSSLIEKLERELKSRGLEVVRTREPGGSGVAEQIRTLILNNAMNPWTELFLYQAARAEHLHQTVLPALAAGKIVLCDRFTDSTLAYQGMARGLPWNKIKSLNAIATQGLKPHLTFWLDLDPALGLRRAQEQTRFEAEGVAFQTLVRKGFAKAKLEAPKRWVKLNSEKQNAEQLFEAALKKILPFVKKGRSRG